MNLRFVEAFHWTVALKSVTRAAEKLHVNELRGSGQGFCYNFGRGIGATFPALVGVLSDRMHLSLGSAIGV